MIEKINNISGVILLGGENRRFAGIIKANIIIGGSTIVSRIISTISDIFEEIIIVTNDPEQFLFAGNYKIVSDKFTKVGPLGGIHAALNASTKESVFVFAGDMPFINKEIVMRQIEYFSSGDADAVVPDVRGNIEPLHAIYRNPVYSKLHEYLSAGNEFGVRDFLSGINVMYLSLPATNRTRLAFTNINTPQEAEEANRLTGIR